MHANAALSLTQNRQSPAKETPNNVSGGGGLAAEA
jgi:hypothetical protein